MHRDPKITGYWGEKGGGGCNCCKVYLYNTFQATLNVLMGILIIKQPQIKGDIEALLSPY